MYYLLYTINALLMIVPPIILGIFIARKRGIGWGLFFSGAVTFILSQVGHIPFNALVLPGLREWFNSWPETAGLIGLALFLGLSAGLFEETARYLTYRYWRRDARTWGSGLMLGAGHGGIEAIIVGLFFSLNFVILSFYDAGFLPNLLANVPAGDLPAAEAAVQMQIDTLFTMPWYSAILGGVERLFAITVHLSLSLMVMQCFTRGNRWWMAAAISWHTLANAGAIVIIGLPNIITGIENSYLSELFLAFVALGSLFIISRFKQPEPAELEPEPLPPVMGVDLSEIEPTPDNLERSRYV